jgi:hypothetical protein
VAGAKFQRRIELFQGDTKRADLWLGTSPGFKKIHVRREGDDQVYAVELTAFDFSVEPKDWLLKNLLAIKDISFIKAADYAIQKANDGWNFVAVNQDTATAKVNAAKATELVNAFSRLEVQEVVTQVPQGEATNAIVKSATGEFEYRFIKADNNYFVQRNDRNIYFKLSQSDVEQITKINKSALMISESEPKTTVTTDPIADITSFDKVIKK